MRFWKKKFPAIIFLALTLLFLAPACPKPPQEKVWVDICNDSFLLVTPWCPGHHMAQYIKGYEPTKPCDMHGPIMVEVCTESGLLPTECCRNKEVRPFIPGEEPVDQCTIHAKVGVEVCTSTGLLPSATCPELEVRLFCSDEKPAETCSIHNKVGVEVCTSTGLLPNAACPAREVRQFYPTDIPTTFCAQHQKKPIPTNDRALIVYGLLGALGDDARWLTYDGTAWKFDRAALQAHLMAISDAGANAIRIFAWGVWSGRPFGKASQLQAFKLVGDKWDLDTWSDYYFPLARQVIEVANLCGLQVIFDWLDQCEIQGGYWRQYSPWANNIQGGYDFYDSAIWPQVRRFMERCVDEFAGLDVLWGFNETSSPDFRPFAKQVYFPLIQAKSLDFTRLSNGADAKMPGYVDDKYVWGIDIQHWVRYDGEEVFGELSILSWIREVHGTRDTNRPGVLDAFLEAWGNNPIRTMFSDDGVWDGDSTCDSVMPGVNPIWALPSPLAMMAAAVLQVRPSAAMWHAIVDRALEYRTEGSFEGKPITKTKAFEHCPKNPDVTCQAATFRAISEAYKDRFGVYPGNHK